MREPIPIIHEPWLSRRHWRRLLVAWTAGRLSQDEFEALKAKVARTRAGPLVVTSRPVPLLRVLQGGRQRPPSGSPTTPHRPLPPNDPVEAA